MRLCIKSGIASSSSIASSHQLDATLDTDLLDAEELCDTLDQTDVRLEGLELTEEHDDARDIRRAGLLGDDCDEHLEGLEHSDRKLPVEIRRDRRGVPGLE